MSRVWICYAVCLAALGLSAAASRAQDTNYPHLDIETVIEVQNDFAFDSDDPDLELNDFFTKTEPAIALYLTENFSLQAGLVIEPLRDPGPQDDRFFEDHGMFAEAFTVNFDTDHFSFFAGKFNPAFGLGFDLAPGIYGEDHPEDYELTERIGFGGSVSVADESLGAITLSASTFFADTSFLSGSAFTNRGRTSESDGGASNTKDFSSFVITLDAETEVGSAAVGGRLAYRRQEAGIGGFGNDHGIAATIYGSVPVTDDIVWEPFFEFARIDNFDGAPEDRTYVTIGSLVRHGPWHAAVNFSHRETQFLLPGMPDVNDHRFQATGGYEFDNRLLVEAGYHLIEEADVTTHVVGFRLSYVLAFTLP